MIDIETRSYPTSVAVGFGRIFYGAQGRVYFSQVIIDDFESAGRCYQRNDPIAEDASNILDTDGGEILIQDAGNIISMEAFKQGILVFCDNGVWFISGTTDAGFSATSYTVNKISQYVLYAKRSVTAAKDIVVFGTKDACYVVTEQQIGSPTVVSLTESRIDTRWKQFITPDVVTVYDELESELYFVKPGTSGEVLLYSTRLTAWYPWKITLDTSTGSHSVAGAVYDDVYGSVVYVNRTSDLIRWSKQEPSTQDFGETFESFLITQPETLGNFSRRKGVPLVKVFMEKTEKNITGYADCVYLFDKPSGCEMSVLFDWDLGLASDPRSIYKALPRGYVAQTVPEVLTSTNTVTVFEDKVRGRGRAVQFKFSSVEDKYMNLLGYSVNMSMNRS